MSVVVTVVTVCRNAERTIDRTIKSVLEQSFRDFEYLVVDGVSTDGTYEIVCGYDDAFRARGISYRHISEKDNGIFDAMNKATDMAEGTWINFMNADDRFHDGNVLENVFGAEKEWQTEQYDVIYGDSMRVYDGYEEFGPAQSIENMPFNMPFCHQCSFTRTKVLQEHGFDRNYMVADYNFFLRLYRDEGRYLHVPLTIADYSMDGFSNQNKYATYLGTVEIKHDLGMLDKNALKQKLKDIYFKALLVDNHPFHGLVKQVDARLSRRAKE